jgi:hypothetical protein
MASMITHSALLGQRLWSLLLVEKVTPLRDERAVYGAVSDPD